jgi:hypothetical protein
MFGDSGSSARPDQLGMAVKGLWRLKSWPRCADEKDDEDELERSGVHGRQNADGLGDFEVFFDGGFLTETDKKPGFRDPFYQGLIYRTGCPRS